MLAFITASESFLIVNTRSGSAKRALVSGKSSSKRCRILSLSQMTSPLPASFTAGTSAVGTMSLYHCGLSYKLMSTSSYGIPFSRRAIQTRSQNGHHPFVSRYRVRAGASPDATAGSELETDVWSSAHVGVCEATARLANRCVAAPLAGARPVTQAAPLALGSSCQRQCAKRAPMAMRGTNAAAADLGGPAARRHKLLARPRLTARDVPAMSEAN
mmetsp:Transcript_126990/g.353697  ORF Transcript_126990/g.353697 Transcript_126990/m.353697 type:complete len:215 (-) Transcript_126990:30-674(-)